MDNFIKFILALVKIRSLVKDRFFAEKLGKKIFDITKKYMEMELEKKESNGDVAQYRVAVEKFILGLDDVSDTLKDLRYLNLVYNIPLLIQEELRLLSIKLESVRNRNQAIESIEKNTNIAGEIENQTKNTVKEINRERIKISGNKKRILEFVKSSPNIRTKDIIYEFSSLSDRTVKRGLIDLLRVGLLKKRVDNKAVYYYASE